MYILYSRRKLSLSRGGIEKNFVPVLIVLLEHKNYDHHHSDDDLHVPENMERLFIVLIVVITTIDDKI